MIRTAAIRSVPALAICALFAVLASSAGSVYAQSPVAQPSPTPSILSTDAKPLPPLPDLRRIGVRPDSPLVLSLNDAIRRALENNNSIEVTRDDVLFAETTLRSLQGAYDPVFTFNPIYTNSTQANSQVFSGVGGSNTLATKTFQFNSDVTKLFETGGGTYTAFFNENRTDSNASLFTTSYRPVFGVQFNQPLWRNRSIDNTRRNIRIQKKRLEQSDLDFRRNTMDVIQLVQRTYWDLVFALRNQQNLIDNLNLSRENLRRVEAQIAAGAAAPIARAEVNTELANRESDLLLATQNVSIAENNLKTLLLRDPNAAEWTAQITPTDNPILTTSPIDLNASLIAARENRPELIRLKLQTDINSIDQQFFRNQTKPRVDLTSTLSSNGLAGTPRDTTEPTSVPLFSTDPDVININANAFLFNQVNILRVQAGLPPLVSPIVTTGGDNGIPANLQGGFGRSLRNAFNFDTRTIEFGVTIQFPFRNRTAEANLAGAKIQQSQIEAQTRLQEQSVISEVRNAVQAVETARLRVISARTARENAEVQLAGENRLFQVGRSTTFLLFQRENELANARNAEVRAETDYSKALADLQRATSTTFQTNNITVTTPTNP